MNNSYQFADQLAATSQYRAYAAAFNLCFSPTAAPIVSIVIPVHNQFDYTIRCLASIRRHTGGLAYEVVVVDDASELSVFLALQEIPGIRTIRNFKNLGFLRSCNRGARSARGHYILLLNNDTEVTTGWLDALLRVFAQRPEAGLVGAKLVYPDGRLQEAGGIVWQDGTAWNYGRNEDPDLPFYNYLREVDYCSGACVILPTSLWRQLAGFDNAYAPAYYEDTDLAFRVRAAARKVYYQPNCVIIHHEGKSSGTDPAKGVKRHQAINLRRFHDRWRSVLAGQFAPGRHFFWARDRSAARKTILFIDHYVPHVDQDAGSRCIAMYMKSFRDAGFNVKFIGDNFFPHQPYQDALEETGVEVLTGNHMAVHWNKWLAENGPYIDYVLLSRAFSSAHWVEPLRLHTKARILFYGHDLISRTLKRAYREFGDPNQLKEAKAWEEKESFVIRRADVVYYSSREEVEELRLQYPDRQIQHLPLYAFPAREELLPFEAEKRNDLLFVGSFGHPPNVDGMRWFLGEILPRLRARLPGVKVRIVGRNPPAQLTEFAGPDVIFHGYVTDSELDELYCTSRMAIAPLRIGGGIKGKLLEAFYKGTPAITTTIGIEGIPATDQDCGIVANPAAFADELASLYSNPGRLASCRIRAFAMVMRHFSEANLRAAFAKTVKEMDITPVSAAA